MKIVSLDTSLEAASSTANVVAADSAKASETKVSDEKQTDINENMDGAIPDDMPLSLYLSKFNRKRKNIVKSPKGKDKRKRWMMTLRRMNYHRSLSHRYMLAGRKIVSFYRFSYMY